MADMFEEIFNSLTKLVDYNLVYPIYSTLKDNGNDYSTKVNVPGFEKEEIDISIVNDVVYIKAKNSESTKSFLVYLPKDSINKEAVSSSLKNGQLILTFPKKTKEQSSTIKVRIG